MTADEFRRHLNDTYTLGNWPEELTVDADTYDHCLAVILSLPMPERLTHPTLGSVPVPPRGKPLMFKGVRLLRGAPVQ